MRVHVTNLVAGGSRQVCRQRCDWAPQTDGASGRSLAFAGALARGRYRSYAGWRSAPPHKTLPKTREQPLHAFIASPFLALHSVPQARDRIWTRMRTFHSPALERRLADTVSGNLVAPTMLRHRPTFLRIVSRQRPTLSQVTKEPLQQLQYYPVIAIQHFLDVYVLQYPDSSHL